MAEQHSEFAAQQCGCSGCAAQYCGVVTSNHTFKVCGSWTRSGGCGASAQRCRQCLCPKCYIGTDMCKCLVVVANNVDVVAPATAVVTSNDDLLKKVVQLETKLDAIAVKLDKVLATF